MKATNYLRRISISENFKLVILRPYQIFGPYQKLDRLIPQVIKFCLKDKNSIVQKVRQKRDFYLWMIL